MQKKTENLLNKITKKQWRWIIAVQAIVLTVAVVIAVLPKAPEPEISAPTAAPEPTLNLPENPYTPDQFSYSGDYLTCTAGHSALGIDVSEWQGEIDWQQVRDAGVEFVMIRVGWRGTAEGVLAEDTMARTYYEGAKNAGLRVGAYFFSQAISPEEAEEEAQFAIDIVSDWQLDLPIVYDWEYISDDSRTADVSNATLTQCVVAFCNYVKQAGYAPMVYFNNHHAVHRLDLEALGGFGFWFAQYDHMLDTAYRVDMWQYSCTGTVPGISGDVDLNLHFVYEES